MTDLAWMKTYIGTETSRTIDLTAEEFGAYERLRRYYWEHLGLPDDDRRLMRITGVDPERWEAVRTAICGLFEEGWRLPALDQERDIAADKRERKVSAGRAGAEKRWRSDSKPNGRPIGIPNGTPNGFAIEEHGRPIADANSKRMAEPLANPVGTQWPLASASDEEGYEEGLGPTRTHAGARERMPVPRFTDKRFAERWLLDQDVFPGDLDKLSAKALAGTLTWADVERAA